MTDHAAARRARANALDAARNHYAIVAAREKCIPHALERGASRVASVLAEDAERGEGS